MEHGIKRLLDERKFREAFDFASRQPNTPEILEDIVAIAQRAQNDGSIGSNTKEDFLKQIVQYLIVRGAFEKARRVLLLVADNEWVTGEELRIEKATGHGPLCFDMGCVA